MANTGRMHVFGPVPSRRLGRSLGVDVIPFKTCSFDCIYCQLGRTTRRTCIRDHYVPISDVMDQVRQTLKDDAEPDFITFSGSGEPTLNSDIGELILSVKAHTDIPVAVLTNGSLLWDKQVREELAAADLIVPSLDAGTREVFQRVNRPHPALEFERIVEGLIEFRRLYDGRLWLEVFLLKDINSMSPEITKIKEHVDAIQPDKIQLNTVVRPTAEDFAHPVPHEQLMKLRDFFGGHAEVISSYEKAPATRRGETAAAEVIAILRRRPCTLDDIASGLGIHRNEAAKHLARLEKRGFVRKTRRDGLSYYQVTETAPENT